eukprot:TRINITY_DN13601_c0_g1_i1.p1 TRINITY_DN13601_c0_g1~~TRINITY_DN13601_c0_g1_i1.p1  ORF type:complete len:505 (+),score=111.36 TRINITY_DN13601_c0_g1_i1:134-1648(+)
MCIRDRYQRRVRGGPTVAMPVPRVELAPGFTISRIINGLWQIADMEREGGIGLDEQSAQADIGAYIAVGQTTFDMADHYGSAEEVMGRVTQQPIPEICTKWVPEPQGGASTQQRKDSVDAAVETSLQRLQAERVDLLQYHCWDYCNFENLEHVHRLRQLQTNGKLRLLGLCNFDTAHTRIVVNKEIPICTNQVSFSLLDTRARKLMLPFCLQNGIQLLCFGCLAGGFLTDRWLGEKDPLPENSTTWSLQKYYRYIQAWGGWDLFQKLLTTLRRIADQYDQSIAAVALKWVLSHRGVASVIVGCRLGHSEHRSAWDTLFEFELNDDDLAQIEIVLGNSNLLEGDCGDEYRKPPFLTASGDLSHHLAKIPLQYPPRQMQNGRQVVTDETGSVLAVCSAGMIRVSGTVAQHQGQVVGGIDVAAQATFILDKIEASIRALGGTMAQVISSRVYLRKQQYWGVVRQVHNSRFGEEQVACTVVVVAELVGDHQCLLQIEVEALVPEGHQQ